MKVVGSRIDGSESQNLVEKKTRMGCYTEGGVIIYSLAAWCLRYPETAQSEKQTSGFS